MGLAPPPLPPTQEEIDMRIKAGATTLKEIDPEFYNWCQRQDRMRAFGYSCMIVGTVVAFLACVLLAG